MSTTKVAILILLSAVTVSAMASPQTCPFTDIFNMSGPGGIQIQGKSTTSGNLKYTRVSNNVFTLGCADVHSFNNGDLYISIGTDATNVCKLTILDGPFLTDPEIAPNCSGNLQYRGYSHAEYSYKYTLNFSKRT